MKSKPTGFYSTVSFQQVIKLVFKLPFVGKYKIVIKKEKQNRFGKSIWKNMIHGPSAGKVGELNGIRFITTSNIKKTAKHP
jgi:hypothetical protein